MVAQLRRAFPESYGTFSTVERQALYCLDVILIRHICCSIRRGVMHCAGSTRALQTRWLARLSAQCIGSSCQEAQRSSFNDADNRRALAQAPVSGMPCPALVADGHPDQCYYPNLGSWYHNHLPTCFPDVAVKCCVEAFSGEEPVSFVCATCNFVKARVEVACAAMYRPMECILPCDAGS